MPFLLMGFLVLRDVKVNRRPDAQAYGEKACG